MEKPHPGGKKTRVKFVCSFGGKISDGPGDGSLRYVGGTTKPIRITPDTSWLELKQKTTAIYRQPHVIRYQLRGEDLDSLVSVYSDEDLRDMMEFGVPGSSTGSEKLFRLYLFATRVSAESKVASGGSSDYGANSVTDRSSSEPPSRSTSGISESNRSTSESVVDEDALSEMRLIKAASALLKKAFGKGLDRNKGRRKELSPTDAALMIQMAFRAYLIRRFRVVRSLRVLAVAKSRLKEIRTLFSDFSYRRCIAQDAEECLRFREKIIVLLLTVDAIEGADSMIRAARKSMGDEVEAMLDLLDQKPPVKAGSIRRRKFDLTDGGSASNELAMGVAEIDRMLDEEDEQQ